MGEVNLFIRKFWRSFSDFISDFIVVAENSYKDLEKLKVNLSEIFLGLMMLEVKSGVSV